MTLPTLLSDRRGFQPAGFIVNLTVFGMLAGLATVVLYVAGASPAKVKGTLWLALTLFASGIFYWAAAYASVHPPDKPRRIPTDARGRGAKKKRR